MGAQIQVATELRIPVAAGATEEEANRALLENWHQHTNTLMDQLGDAASLVGRAELDLIASGSAGLRNRIRDEAQRPNGFIAMHLRSSGEEARSSAETRAINLTMDCADPDKQRWENFLASAIDSSASLITAPAWRGGATTRRSPMKKIPR